MTSQKHNPGGSIDLERRSDPKNPPSSQSGVQPQNRERLPHHSRRRSWWKTLWLWSLWGTGPVTVLFIIWLSAVGTRYQTLGLRYNAAGGASVMLRPIMAYEYERLIRKASLVFSPSGAKKNLEQVHLWVPEGNEQALRSSLPRSGFEYVEGGLSYPDGSLHDVSVRFRGDMPWHWALDKTSWRVKTKKANLWNGMRRFNVMRAKSVAMVETHLAFWFAGEMGLLAPRTNVVELWINGKNRGVHALVEQPGELFLRQNKRMPGDLFSGELIGRTEVEGWTNRIFDMPGTWDKSAINNHYPAEHRESLTQLCAVLDLPPGQEQGKRLRDLVDIPAFAKFAAFRTLVQSGHMDDVHNWRLYYDPWRNCFEPVVWDPMGWASTWGPFGEYSEFDLPAFCDLDRALLQDAGYRAAVHAEIVAVFEQGLPDRLIERLQQFGPQVLEGAKRDPGMSIALMRYDEDAVGKALEELERRMRQYFGVLRERHLVAPIVAAYSPPQKMDSSDMGNQSGNPAVFQEGDHRETPTHPETSESTTVEWYLPIAVQGVRPVPGIRLSFAGVPPVEADWRIRVWQGTGWIENRIQPSLDGSDWLIPGPFPAGIQLDPVTGRGMNFTHHAVPAEANYQLCWALPAGSSPLELTEVRTWIESGASAALTLGMGQKHSATDEPLSFVFGLDRMQPSGEPLHWSGSRTLHGHTEIYRPLVIEAGSVIAMEPGSSLLLHAPLYALGTEQMPIRFEPSMKGQPWGAVALRTANANGSRLEHVEFFQGSGWKDGLQEYSGMFSVHDVQGVRIHSCRFEGGMVVDDMVHAVYAADLRFESCDFVGAMSDALDLDGCQAEIVNCTFSASGNDALDLMMSQVTVQRCSISGSGDKGISVGEGSQLHLAHTTVSDCVVGVQVKDGSLAAIQGGLFSDNELALDAYKKNWQYGSGGHGFATGVQMRGNVGMAQADRQSTWRLWNCDGGEEPTVLPNRPRSQSGRVLYSKGKHLEWTGPQFAAFTDSRFLRGVLPLAPHE